MKILLSALITTVPIVVAGFATSVGYPIHLNDPAYRHAMEEREHIALLCTRAHGPQGDTAQQQKCEARKKGFIKSFERRREVRDWYPGWCDDVIDYNQSRVITISRDSMCLWKKHWHSEAREGE